MARLVTMASGIGATLLAAGVVSFISAAAQAANQPANGGHGMMGNSAMMSTMPPRPIGDATRGAQIFLRCAMCHNADKGGGNGLGPNLFGVVGRKAASLPDFPYSSALKNSKIVWTEDKLKAWVSGPARLVPGNRMAFAGLSDPKQAGDVVAYLKTRK